jgi:hypothetical protein
MLSIENVFSIKHVCFISDSANTWDQDERKLGVK